MGTEKRGHTEERNAKALQEAGGMTLIRGDMQRYREEVRTNDNDKRVLQGKL